MVEFAVVAPVMILLILGVFEIGRLMMVKNAATYASREGARVGVTPTASRDEVVQRVEEVMAAYNIPDPQIEVQPESLGMAEPGDMVTITVSVDAASVSWVGNALDLAITDVVGSTSMRRESTQ
ncbi:TadE family protein [Roseimaritima sediminicola]|uniref:TadE family protein n=1 Tax=Roseimaritima sediminicola TaxID=2662066 RepID=UPI001386EB33|nr:TadE family protein [Roseimaritima sediminicola]